MGDGTGIAWTDATWNPVRGCSRVSRGCEHCYAESVARRFSGPGMPYEGLVRLDAAGKAKAQWNGTVRLVPEHLADPLRWRKPRRIFVNSMSDLFHEALPFETIAAIFGVMAVCPTHTFQVLTKRPERARAFMAWAAARGGAATPSDVCLYAARMAIDDGPGDPWEPRIVSLGLDSRDEEVSWPLPNVHLGVSVEDQATADERIPVLLDTPAAVRWVSYEPALGPVDFRAPWLRAQHLPDWGRASDGRRGCNTCCNGDRCDNPRHVDRRQCTACGGSGFLPDRGLDWIVVGGESGPGARPFDLAWARATVEQCRVAEVPCFVKQMGSRPRGNFCRTCDGTGRFAGEVCEWCGGQPSEHAMLDDRKGADPREWPSNVRVREYPEVRRG